jgi:hypothetical protein
MRMARANIRSKHAHWAESRKRSRALRYDPRLLETLESRLLLSATFLPTYQIFQPANGEPANTISPTGLTVSQVRHAYGFDQFFFGNVVGDGSGQTIAIVDAEGSPNIVADLHAFDQAFGLNDPVLTVLNQDGGTNQPQAFPGSGANVETCMDVEWAHAMAPGANIVLVLADTLSDADIFAAIDTARHVPGVSVVSMSFGAVENSVDFSQASLYTTPNGHTGITFVASSGDHGAFGNGGSSTQVLMPAALPTVVAVGGTRLILDASGNYLSERAWGSGDASGNGISDGGGGGGLSNFVDQPIFQQGIVTQSSVARGVPDVAFLADPFSGVSVFDSFDSPDAPWITVGGTSLAAPMFAGLMSIVNQGSVLAGGTPLDGATQTLPRLYGLPSADFHDITSGNNGFPAGVGYDLASGRGTPIISSFIPDMVAQIAIGSLSAGGGQAISGATIELVARNVAAAHGATVSSVKFYRESNGVDGFQPGSDQAIGVGIKNHGNWTLATTTRGLIPGTYTYYAVAQNSLNVITSAPLAATLTLVTPTIGSFSATANINGSATLTANDVTEGAGGEVASVTFYAESGDNPGFQPAEDTTSFFGNQNGTTWTASTGALPDGDYTFYAVATDTLGASGNVSTAMLTITAPPPNDNFVNAAIINGTLGTVTAATFLATKEKGEPKTIATLPGGRSVWWKWVAPVSGQVTLDTLGSDFDTLLGVYTGKTATPKVSGLKLVVANDNDGLATTSAVSFHAVAGTTYFLLVDGPNGLAGNVTLNLSEIASPANDDFVNATDLGNATFSNNTATNLAASLETKEPKIAGHGGSASVWFKWTAPTAGSFTLTTTGSDFNTLLGVYTGKKVSFLKLVGSNANGTDSSVTFTAKAGAIYYFVVDGLDGATGNILLSLETPI